MPRPKDAVDSRQKEGAVQTTSPRRRDSNQGTLSPLRRCGRRGNGLVRAAFGEPSLSQDDTPNIIVDPQWGFQRLDPIPSNEELADYYQSKYYHAIKKGGRGLQLNRLMSGGQEAEKTRMWLEHALYDAVIDALKAAPGHKVLDVGCGTGELVEYLSSQGCDAHGVEPAEAAVEFAQSRGISVECGDLGGHLKANPSIRYDAIVFLNVIEHSPEPTVLLQQAYGALKPGGLVICRVPNDFSPIQEVAQLAIAGRPWWIVVPDHINYFNFETFPPVLERLGFQVLDTFGDYPMEFFLLMNRNYVEDPEVGKACHQERMRIEMSLSSEQLRAVQRGYARAGIGRNAHFVAQKPQD